jgi:AcrR family transcriptional regulator
MGHRDALLAAARRCLEERGYARTTARDLVAESGTNLGSIGYHFGSKEALLAEALEQAFEEYTEKILAVARSAPSDVEPGDAGAVSDRIRSSWVAIAEQLPAIRPMTLAVAEALAQAERNPALRRRLAGQYQRLRRTIASVIMEVTPQVPPETARVIASFHMALADGLIVQWLLDPRRTPSGEELFDAARLLFRGT